MVFKGKDTHLMKDLHRILGIVVRFSLKGWMNNELTVDYLRTIISVFWFSKHLLVWDAYKCHTHVRVTLLGQKRHIYACTMLLSRVAVQNTSKQQTWCGQKQNEEPLRHMAVPTEVHEFTHEGNMKASSQSLLCKWVKASWAEVSTEMAKASFMSCAITAATKW